MLETIDLEFLQAKKAVYQSGVDTFAHLAAIRFPFFVALVISLSSIFLWFTQDPLLKSGCTSCRNINAFSVRTVRLLWGHSCLVKS